jgi:hypothetical protein
MPLPPKGLVCTSPKWTGVNRERTLAFVWGSSIGAVIVIELCKMVQLVANLASSIRVGESKNNEDAPCDNNIWINLTGL